jgi:hypothetical protein
MDTSHRLDNLRPAHKTVAVIAAVLLALTAVFALSSPGPASAQNEAKPDATIRVINASPGSPALDVLLNGQPLVQKLQFGSPSSYATLKEGSYKLQLVPAGQPAANAIAEKDFDASSGEAYIVSIVNPLKDVKINVDKVNLDSISPGKARVRVFHDSPDAGKFDVAVTGGDTWFSGLSSGDKSDYKDVDAGTYSLDVRGDNNTTLTTATGLQLQAGQVYDIFAIGQIADKTFTLVPLETSVSEPCVTTLGLKGTATDACVRVIHASPGAPGLDVYFNGTAATKNLAFGAVTDFVVVPSGDSNKVQITSTGASVDNAAVSDTVTLDPGQAYDMAATGTLDNLKLTQTRLDLTPLPTGQARIRFINASPDAGKVDFGIKNGDTLFTGTDFRDVTDYKVVDAASLTLDVRKGGENQVLAEGTVDVKEAMVYDLVLIGQVKDQSLKVLAVSAPASTRKGAVTTPVAEGTTSPVATVASEATVSTTAGAMTTAQVQATVSITPAATMTPTVATTPTPATGAIVTPANQPTITATP